jgi:hypothetical protein
MHNKPYTAENTTATPWLINVKPKELLVYKGNKLSAEYIWSLNEAEREKLVDYLFDHFRLAGFPYPKISDTKLQQSYSKLKEYIPCTVGDDNVLQNSGSIGLDIVKHFHGAKFYGSKTENGRSVLEVFNNDELLRKVLKNRLGWCTSSEDGAERPYAFGLTNDMLIQGIRSSGLSKSISQFKIPLAQFLYSTYCPKGGTVGDFSAGWGARLLGAASLGFQYYGIDPLTAPECQDMLNLYEAEGLTIKGGSEDVKSYERIPQVDVWMSSPPYFNLECYADDAGQCYAQFPEYSTWLEKYWRPTVANCLTKLIPGGRFILVMNDSYKKYNLLADMTQICLDSGLRIEKEYFTKTSKSHLSSKKQSGENVKFNDRITVFSSQ